MSDRPVPKTSVAESATAPRPLLPAGTAGGAHPPLRVRDYIDRRSVQVGFTMAMMVTGAVLGYMVGVWYATVVGARYDANPSYWLFNVVCIAVLGSLLGFLLSSTLFRQLIGLLPRIEQSAIEDRIAGVFGVVLGLVVAVLVSPLVGKIPKVGSILVWLAYLFSVFFGLIVGISMKKELVRMFSNPARDEPVGPAVTHGAVPKLMDTNVIIDGRILEVLQAGFLEGELIVPQFVLDELHAIADSADELKRARGRRGLDLLNRLKEEVEGFRVLKPRDYAVPVNDVHGVDGKLVKLASAMDAWLLTNDFNLAKVAEVQNIRVLNVNRLAIALKPVVMAGEELRVNIIRQGRDPGQGVAYLDDGTMVVVEEADHKIGRVVDVVVSSMLQTVAGKMIFATLKENGGAGGRGPAPR